MELFQDCFRNCLCEDLGENSNKASLTQEAFISYLLSLNEEGQHSRFLTGFHDADIQEFPYPQGI